MSRGSESTLDSGSTSYSESKVDPGPLAMVYIRPGTTLGSESNVDPDPWAYLDSDSTGDPDPRVYFRLGRACRR
jgi:hypothetical protein